MVGFFSTKQVMPVAELLKSSALHLIKLIKQARPAMSVMYGLLRYYERICFIYSRCGRHNL